MKKTRILIGIMGLDQHEVGAVAVSRILRDAGFEVIYTGRFNLPSMIVQTCLQEGVDLLGLSCHSWEYLYFLPELLDLLKANGLDIPVMVGGSVITPGDAARLTAMGVRACFGPGTTPAEIITTVNRLAGLPPV